MSSSQNQKYKVSASNHFVRIFQNLSTTPSRAYPAEQPDVMKVSGFISEYLSGGWNGALSGKNRCSDNVPTDADDWLEKVRYAQKHNLYHYHIGIPYYENKGNGYSTSEYVIHYQQLNNYHIKLVDLDYHPMTLPKTDYLEGDILLGG